MLNKKRSIATILILCLVFALTLLPACAKNNNEGDSNQENQANEKSSNKNTANDKDNSNSENSNSNNLEENTNEELEFVELEWYYPNTPQAEQDLVFEKANETILEELNAKVNFHPTDWGSYNQKMQVKISSGEEFDLCFTANWSNNYYQNISKNAFLPLDDLLNEYAPNLMNNIPAKMWDATKVNGNIYGIINYQISAMTNSLIFNKTYVDKYNFDYKSIKSLKDVEPYLQIIKENEPNLIPIDFHNHPGSMLGYNLASLGFDEIGGRNIPGAVYLNNETLEVVNQFESKEFESFCLQNRDWYEKGYIREDAISIKDSNPDMKAGKIAVGFSGNYKPGCEEELSSQYGIDIVASPISNSYLLTSSIISTMHAVSVTSTSPERAVMFMELMNSDFDLYNLVTYGLDGKHYNKIDDKYIEPIKDSKYNPGTPWLFGSVANAYLLPGQSEDVWPETEKINMNAKPSPLLGFSFNPEPVNTEIAQCNSVVAEFLPGLDTGSVDTDIYLPQFIEKLKSADVDVIISEMQSQINEWKKTK